MPKFKTKNELHLLQTLRPVGGLVSARFWSVTKPMPTVSERQNTENQGHPSLQGHQIWYQLQDHMRLSIGA